MKRKVIYLPPSLAEFLAAYCAVLERKAKRDAFAR